MTTESIESAERESEGSKRKIHGVSKNRERESKTSVGDDDSTNEKQRYFKTDTMLGTRSALFLCALVALSVGCAAVSTKYASSTLLRSNVAEMERTLSMVGESWTKGAEELFFDEEVPLPDMSAGAKESLMELDSSVESATARPPVLSKMQYAIRNIIDPTSSVKDAAANLGAKSNQPLSQRLAGKLDAVIASAYEDLRQEQAKLASHPMSIPEDPAKMPSKEDRNIVFLEMDRRAEAVIPAALVPDSAPAATSDSTATGKTINAAEIPGLDIPLKLSMNGNQLTASLANGKGTIDSMSAEVAGTPLTAEKSDTPKQASSTVQANEKAPWKLEPLGGSAGPASIEKEQPQQQQQQQQAPQHQQQQQQPRYRSKEWVDEDQLSSMVRSASAGVPELLKQVEHHAGNAIIHADINYDHELLNNRPPPHAQRVGPVSQPQDQQQQAESRPRLQSLSNRDIDSMIHTLQGKYHY